MSVFVDLVLANGKRRRVIVHLSGSGNDEAPSWATKSKVRAWSYGGVGASDEGVSGGASGFSEHQKNVTGGDLLAYVINSSLSSVTWPDLAVIKAYAAFGNIGGTASGPGTNITGSYGVSDSNGATAPNGVFKGPHRSGGKGGSPGSKNDPGGNGQTPGGGGGSGGKDGSSSSGGGPKIVTIFDE